MADGSAFLGRARRTLKVITENGVVMHPPDR